MRTAKAKKGWDGKKRGKKNVWEGNMRSITLVSPSLYVPYNTHCMYVPVSFTMLRQCGLLPCAALRGTCTLCRSSMSSTYFS